MRNMVSNKSGVTLVEILVTASILTIVLGVSFGAMRTYDIFLNVGTTKSQLNAEASRALNTMSRELALSSRSKVTIANSPTFDYETGDPFTDPKPTPDTVSFNIPTGGLDSQQNIQWGDGINIGEADYTIVYKLAELSKANQLVRELTDAPTGFCSLVYAAETVSANNIIDLQFTLPSGENYIDIDIVAGKPSRAIFPALIVALSTRVDFRN